MTQNTQLHAEISPRLLTELPRFFGGFEQALGELFQNAHRAGAQTVAVIYDPDKHTLILVDNGAGLDDPQKLLTAGETGWDETRVVEPAGVGAFAILRDEFVTRVEYVSHGAGDWEMSLTPAILHGEATRVEWISNPTNATGLSVKLSLQPSIEITEQLLRRARGFYPFKVKWTTSRAVRADDTAEWKTIEPYRPRTPDLVLETSVGVLEWTRWRATDRERVRAVQAVWEWRALASHELDEALSHAAQAHAYSELAREIIRDGNVRWFVEPSSGVRPKLPDRNALDDNELLQSAATMLIDALVARVLDEMQSLTASWPARPVESDLWRLCDAAGATWQNTGYLLRYALPILGWRRVEYTDLDGVYVYDTSDGIEVETPQVTVYDRAALPVASRALNITLNILNAQGESVPSASLSADATDPRVTVIGLHVSEASPHVALAERIEVEGIGAIPYLLTEEDAFDLPGLDKVGAAVIFAGTPAAFLDAWKHSDALVHAVFLHSESYFDWIGSDGGESQIERERVRSEVTLEVTQAFAPELVAARQHYYAVDALIEPTRAASCAVAELLRMFPDLRHDQIMRQQVPVLEECREILKALEDVVETHAQNLAGPAELV